MNKQRITLNYKNALDFITIKDIEAYQGEVDKLHKALMEKTGLGKDFLGWVELPNVISKKELDKINDVANKIKEKVDAFVSIGIGGSYLGAKAVIEALGNAFYNNLPKSKRKTPEIYFAGQNISTDWTYELLELLKEKSFAINVISKSGTTTEPAIAFRIFKKALEDKVGIEKSKELIIATTDEKSGALRQLTNSMGYESFVIPDDVGGRYSVLTAVGLLPIAVAGIDIYELIEGAKDAYNFCNNLDLHQNPAYMYAVIRNILYKKGKLIEILVNYTPYLHYFSEWWKQLYGESEGKDKKGIFPASCDFTTDLHSMGQYIQDGNRILFETVLNVTSSKNTIVIEEDKDNLDKLNYLKGKTLDYVNEKAQLGTIMAHVSGGVPNIVINIPQLTPYYIGQLIYFFEKACGMSGYLLGVNPFDQPGVEAYKKNMFALLGKPGSEEETQRLNALLMEDNKKYIV